MAYDRNAKAYIILSKIEIVIRELLIKEILEKGVHEWSTNFLGKIHLNSLKEIGERIYKNSIENLNPNIEDVYIQKINRELKNEASGKKKLSHPFYYLTWNELLSLIENKQNQKLIEDSIGKINLRILKENLARLGLLRNDVAHSRFISEEEMLLIEGASKEISAIIPDFKHFADHQMKEESLDNVLQNLHLSIEMIESHPILQANEIDQALVAFFKAKNSFWLNCLNYEVELLEKMFEKMKDYKILRNKPGGLLMLQKWKKQNSDLLHEIKQKFKNG